nr:MAG TPA: hypothetical protein [Caudoviricetes sp.]
MSSLAQLKNIILISVERTLSIVSGKVKTPRILQNGDIRKKE